MGDPIGWMDDSIDLTDELVWLDCQLDRLDGRVGYLSTHTSVTRGKCGEQNRCICEKQGGPDVVPSRVHRRLSLHVVVLFS